MINKCCSWANTVLRNIFLFGGSNPPSPSTACYVTEFETTAPDNVINSINIGGDIDVPLNIPANDSIGSITSGIESALNSSSVTYSFVGVERTDIGGGLFSFVITVYESNTLINIIDISGNAYVFVLTSCDPNAQFIVDGDLFTSLGIVAPNENSIFINWGDGNTEIIKATGSQEIYPHTYASGGNKTISITGAGITELDFGGAASPDQTLQIIALPTTLTLLGCVEQLLTSLPALPSGLESLSVRNNQLTALPALPNTLQLINCGGNQITSLPALPTSLLNLSCRLNQLTTLPTLPPLLLTSKFSSNQLPVSVVNQVLVELDTNGLANGSVEIESQTPAAPPSGAGATAAANLITNGWAVVTD